MRYYLIIFFTSYSFLLNAQTFMPEFNFGLSSGEAELTMNDGTIHEGKIKLTGAGFKGIMINVETSSGQIIKGRRDNMKAFKIKAPETAVGKLLSVASPNSLKSALNTDYKELLDSEYYYFSRLLNKKGKPGFYQLINPGFDTKIQVYSDPNAKETKGGQLTGGLIGGEAKSYYFAKGSSTTNFVEKKKYKKSFTTLYDGCSAMEAIFPDRKWSNVALHVYYYDQNCN